VYKIIISCNNNNFKLEKKKTWADATYQCMRQQKARTFLTYKDPHLWVTNLWYKVQVF